MIHNPKILLDKQTQSSPCGSHERATVFGTQACGSHPDPRWHVFQTHSQAESWAEVNLVRQGYEVFVPRETVLKRDRVLRTMTHKVEVCCFPGYGFVRFCAATDPWRPIVSTRGVRRLFCTMSERPMPVRVGDVERLIADADIRRVVETELPPIEEGVELAVTAGPFQGHEGVCVSSSTGRTRLLLPLFGAEVVVEVARGAVRQK